MLQEKILCADAVQLRHRLVQCLKALEYWRDAIIKMDQFVALVELEMVGELVFHPYPFVLHIINERLFLIS